MSHLVVVLDEDDSVFDAVARQLEDAGYLVLPLSTADDIVDELKVTHAAALLLDLQLGSSAAGLDVLVQIQQDADLRTLPVLGYSVDAVQLEGIRSQLLERGCGIVQKPLDMDQVLRWLREHVG